MAPKTAISSLLQRAYGSSRCATKSNTLTNVACLLLVGVLCFNAMGYYATFKLRQQQLQKEIKQRIKKGIPENELHAFVFHKHTDKIDWVRPGKEFRHGQEMYDIVRQETIGDSIYYLCVNDTEEGILFANLDEMVKQELSTENSQPARNGKKPIKQSKTLVYTVPLAYNSILVYCGFSSLLHKPIGVCTAPYLEHNSPPPWCVFSFYCA